MNHAFLICPICGDPVPQFGTRAKRLYHPECKKLKNYLAAAVRAGKAIELLDDQTKKAVRGLFFAAANEFRASQPRDANGRFASPRDD
jgi:hypothetical protein